MGMEYRFGLMDLSMRVNGNIIKLMELENLLIQMEIFMKENGKMINPMEKENIYIKMELIMMENGLKNNNMDLEQNIGMNKLNILVISNMEKSMVKVKSYGVMEAHMKVNGLKII